MELCLWSGAFLASKAFTGVLVGNWLLDQRAMLEDNADRADIPVYLLLKNEHAEFVTGF